MRNFVLFMAVFLICSFPSKADILYLSFGPTVDGSIGSQKMASIDYELTRGAPSLLLDVGGFNEMGGGPAFYGGVSAGVHIVTDSGLTSRIGFGPVFISQTDDRLSSLFEFHIQARSGLDLKSWETGIQFDHFSNAGLVPPNLGRDAIGLYVGIPL